MADPIPTTATGRALTSPHPADNTHANRTESGAGETGPRIGSLCSGYGGLDLGLMAVVGGSIAWHVEYDKHPSAVLDARFPGVPNYGDITTTDWTQVEPVDWLTAGYPCQPFSHAGKRKGKDDERHLWPFVADAIGALRPRRVLLENVAGHVSLGLDAVLWDLAALGYDATWGVVRAADAGAPHGRARIFVVAADARCERHGGWQDGRGVGRVDREDAGEARERSRAVIGDRGAATPADTDEPGRQGSEPAGRRDLPTWSTTADAEGQRRPGVAEGDDATSLERPGPGAGVGDRPRRVAEGTGGLVGSARVEWGAYRPAIRRWEHVTGRSAPRPTEPGRTGERLSPRFVEWLMGLPAGWVTGLPIPRNAQLKALGNGCVPQQAALGLSTLLRIPSPQATP